MRIKFISVDETGVIKDFKNEVTQQLACRYVEEVLRKDYDTYIKDEVQKRVEAYREEQKKEKC